MDEILDIMAPEQNNMREHKSIYTLHNLIYSPYSFDFLPYLSVLRY